MADKQYQIVVLGASGFVGKLVAKHLAQDYVVGYIHILYLWWHCDDALPLHILMSSARP